MSYDSEVLADSPRLYWKLDETSGTTMADSSGNGRDGTASGSFTLNQPGPPGGRAIEITGTSTSDGVVVTDAWSPTDFSIEWWLNPVSFLDYNLEVTDGTSWGSFHCHTTGAGEIYCGMGIGDRFTPSDLGDYTSEVFQHCVFTFDSGTGEAKFYKDKVLLATKTMAPGSPLATFGILQGDGLFSRVATYDSVLSSTRVAAHFDAAVAGVTFDGEGSLVLGGAVSTAGGELVFDGEGALVFGAGVSSVLWTDSGVSAFVLTPSAQLSFDHYTWVDPDADDPATGYHDDILVSFPMPEPALVMGRPVLPGLGWMNPAQDVTNFSSLGGSTVATKPAPKPRTIHGHTENGSHTDVYSWVADDITDLSPAYAGLGWVNSWPGRLNQAGSPGSAPTFHSVYPYRPMLQAHHVYTLRGGHDGSEMVTYDKVAHFNHEFVEHMWVDIGYTFSGPFTWIMLGMILGFPTEYSNHYLLDATVSGGTRVIDPPLPVGLVDRISSESSSAAKLLFGRHAGVLSGDYNYPAHKHVSVKHSWLPIPRMYYGVFNGDDSAIGVIGRGHNRRKTGKVNMNAQRHLMVGRRSGYSSQHHASQLGVLEMRFYPDALSEAQLNTEYRQLKKRFDLAKYRT